VILAGELLLPQDGLPDFVVYKNSIHHWEPPHDGDTLDEATRHRIIEIVRAEMTKRRMTIEVE
jgi:hypothetical protein